MSNAELHPLAPIWPPARIRITTNRLELRMPTDEDIAALPALIGEGIYDPSTMPFASPWAEQPAPRSAEMSMQWHLKQRAEWTPQRWSLLLLVYVDGQIAGAQDVGARDFAIRRTVDSGSWLGRRFQGAGLGTEMRHAMLSFAFEGLGAAVAQSDAWVDNPASIRVSEKCGYVANGVDVAVRRRGPLAPGGESEAPAELRRFRLERAVWRAVEDRPHVEIHGLDHEVLASFGVSVGGDD